MLTQLLGPLFSVIFPTACRVCGGTVGQYADGVACGECWFKTRVFRPDDNLCKKCGYFLEGRGFDDISACGRCIESNFDRARSIGVYEKALSATILELKRTPHLPHNCEKKLAAVCDASGFGHIDVIIPVPLSKRRFIERGFNQADVIANKLGKRLRTEVDSHSLVRSVHTPRHRAGMDKKAREMTVQNAFKVVRPKLINSRNVLLIDDVFTSGATASSCARVLKKNGAATVSVLTIARAS